MQKVLFQQLFCRIMDICVVNEQLWLLQSSLLIITWQLLHHYPLRFVQKKPVERFCVKATVCNFSPPGRKVNPKFPPQHLSLTLMSCLPWNSTSPEAKITDIPQAATGVGEADAKHRQTKKGGRKKANAVSEYIWCKTSFILLFCCRRGCSWDFLLSLTFTGTTSTPTTPAENRI